MAQPTAHDVRDLLLISDLHLGSHLKPRTRGEYVHLAASIDENLPRFLDHYRERGRWQLVINGDFIDFWNIEIAGEPGDPETTAVSRAHAVFDDYPGVEEALGRFCDAGNGIVFVAGNHDAELLYPRVRRAIRDRIMGAREAAPASITHTGATRLDALDGGRIHFVPWFLREAGGAWIEHGHLFDSACSTPAVLSPTRGGALVKSVAEVATRSFTNMMPEMDYDAADHFGVIDYVRWTVSRGFRFMMRVVFLYLRMVGRMLALWARGGVDQHGREQHDARLAKVAANAGLQMSALTALQSMAPPPSSVSVWGVLSVTALDLVLAALGPLALASVLAWWFGGPAAAWLLAGVLGGAAAVFTVRSRRRPRDVARDMCAVAASVGDVTGVPLVLMGHSHHGSLERRGGVVYGNSGSWLDGSHLVVRRNRDGKLCEVQLRRWRNGGVVVTDAAQIESAEPRELHETTLLRPGLP